MPAFAELEKRGCWSDARKQGGFANAHRSILRPRRIPLHHATLSSIPAGSPPSPASASSAPASRDPPPLADGFDAIEAHLAGIGRPPTAFCACELRSPAQFTDAGFVAFNRHYVERLAAWGIFRDEVNPVARSNVCPEIDPPATPVVLRLQLHRAGRKRRGAAALSPPAAAKRARAAPAMPSASSGSATSRPRRCARRRASSSGRWSGAWRRSASAGPM